MARAAGPAALLALTVLLLFFDFGVRVLATNDETRFPMLARDILAHGNWVLPQIGGVPHLNKPPLYAWLVALGAWPGGGVTQSSALWPSLMAAIGVVIATAWIGRRLWNRAIGLTAGFIVVTMHGVFTLARAPMPDMMLCFVLTAAMAAFVAAEFDGRRLALVVFYVLIGVGFWTKGPAALLGLAIVAVFTVRTGGWRRLRRLALPGGLALIVLIIAPWWVLGATAGGEQFVQDILVTDWLLWYLPVGRWSWRMLTEPVVQPLAILLPWSPLLLLAVVSAGGTKDQMSAKPLTLLLVWFSTVLVLVGVSEQQRMRYYLPLCPPAAVLIAVWYHGLVVRHRKVVGAAAAALVTVGLIVWQVADDVRHNARTELGALELRAVTRDAPLYVVEVPDLVLAFYLDRSVGVLPTPHEAASTGAPRPPGYLAVADRVLPLWLDHRPVAKVAAGAVNGRRFSVLHSGAPAPPDRPRDR